MYILGRGCGTYSGVMVEGMLAAGSEFKVTLLLEA